VDPDRLPDACRLAVPFAALALILVIARLADRPPDEARKGKAASARRSPQRRQRRVGSDVISAIMMAP